MDKRKRNILIGILSSIIALLIFVAGSVYYLFFTCPFQISGTTYIYIDHDDNIDSVYTKIIDTAHPKSMKGLELLAQKNDYANHIKTGKYAINPNDNMRYLERYGIILILISINN